MPLHRRLAEHRCHIINDTEIYEQMVANLVFRRYEHFTQIDV